MAIENRQFITLDEIVGIQYACKSCGASVSIPRKQWPMVQHDCPAHCGDGSGVGKHAEWIERRGPEEQKRDHASAPHQRCNPGRDRMHD
jgi:hypothetical protein